MAIDKISIDGNIAVTSGVLTLTSRLYMNPTVVAGFSSIGANNLTVALGPGNQSILVTAQITPGTANGVYAENKRYVQDHLDDGAGTLL